MNIKAVRGDWQEHNPDLVVLIGDPYSDFIGPVPEVDLERLQGYSAGFAEGQLRREVNFSSSWGGEDSFDFVYYHTSTQKGFTGTENIKTFVSKALHQASETGRKKVAVLLKGPQGDGITDQIVEGGIVGTFSFREYKRDTVDRFEEMELLICLPSPVPVTPVLETEAAESDPQEVVESVAAEEESPESSDEPTEEKVEETEAQAQVEAPDSEAEDQDAGEEEEAQSEESGSTVALDEEEVAEIAEEVAGQEEAEAAEAPEDVTPDSKVPDEVWEVLAQADESAIQVGTAFGEAVNFARSLVARPAADCTPDYLAKVAKKLSSSHGFSYQAFGPKQLAQHDYQGLVTVGKGADNSPRMFEMTYTPEVESDVHLVLLGKGVTFDSGGISIKGSDKMHLMIGDMAGAAAVIGAMDVIGRLKPNIKVTGIVVSAENKPGAKSYRPGDIIRYKNGTSVHVENTDAEGRLILADGLIRAGELAATHIVDVATLTGAASRALGPSFTGVMGANRRLVNAITRAGGNHGESYWRLPMPLEYREMLKSVHADINNMGGPYAGATTAALFLKEFVPPRTAWVHLDIAGTFWKQKPWKYYQEGPSGTGVKTLADLALRWKEHIG